MSTSTSSTTRFESVDARGITVAAAGVKPLPVEQAPAYEAFEESEGFPLWRRLIWKDGEKAQAVVTLYTVPLVRGMHYLLARKGPVWFKENSPEREAQFRADLRQYIRDEGDNAVYVRMNQGYVADDLREPYNVITFERTVVIDTSSGTEDGILETMQNDGRRAVRRAKKRAEKDGIVVRETTGLSREEFDRHYAILAETAGRQGFSTHPKEHYWNLLDLLGPEHARLFTAFSGVDEHGAPAADAEILGWDLILVNDKMAAAQYGASSASGRRSLAPDLIDFTAAATLGAEGIKGLDLVGAHSARCPDLYTVGRYKERFAQSFTWVAPMWDMPLRPTVYRALAATSHARKALRERRSGE